MGCLTVIQRQGAALMPNRILVVDDLSLSRVILRARLSSACYDILLAATGQQALSIARAELPDLVLLDCSLPDLDGFEICKALRRAPETAHIPVILFSATNTRDRRLQALECGADDFLGKPLDEGILLSRLRALLRCRALEREHHKQATPALRASLAASFLAGAPAGRVCLVQPDPAPGQTQTQIDPSLHDLRCDLTSALKPASSATVPDIFLLAPEVLDQHGLAIISEFHSRPLTRHVPITVLLAPDQQIDPGMVMDLGAECVLSLPLDLTEAQMRLGAMIQRKRWADALRHAMGTELDLASRDPLTGLFNRRHALSYLAEIVSDQSTRHFALLMIDLDNFKQVNDKFGHLVGDQVLTEVAARMAAAIRPDDLLARYGGEEFLLVLPGIDLEHAQRMAERLRRQIEGAEYRISQGGGRLRMTASIGVTMHDCAAYEPIETVRARIQVIINQADQALHVAKNSGRNRVALACRAVA